MPGCVGGAERRRRARNRECRRSAFWNGGPPPPARRRQGATRRSALSSGLEFSGPKLSRPGPRRLRLVFEGIDLVLLEVGEADVVETVEHQVLEVRVDLEFHHAAIGSAD